MKTDEAIASMVWALWGVYRRDSYETLLDKLTEMVSDYIDAHPELREQPTPDMWSFADKHGIDGEVDAYAKFIHAISMRALTSSRISSYEKPTDNDKFTMRLFLNNLGFKGEEYKFARRFLVRNLDGNGAWRYGNAPDASGFDLEMPTVFTPTVNASALDETTGGETEDDAKADDGVGDGEEESTDEE